MRNRGSIMLSTVIQNIEARKPLLRAKQLRNLTVREPKLELIATLFWVLLPVLFGPISWMILFLLIKETEIGKYLAMLYLMWMYFDKESCERGGRRSKWFRGLNLWTYFGNYFPVKLVKSVELPPDRNYLFAVFPHGILSSGAFAAFSTDALNFNKLFRGLTSYVCTLSINFHMPFIREVALAAGLNSASRNSLNWILSSPGKGRAAVLIVGGAAEAMCSHPGQYKIILKGRKGFCKVALENGSPLVPVFSFGEIDIYQSIIPKEDSFLRRFQNLVKKFTRIAPVIYFGTGIFNSRYGFLPRRTPVTVVVGKPIEVERVFFPSPEQIDELHSKFMQAIINLFNEEKHKYLEDPTTELIVD